MNLKDMIQSKINQTQREMLYSRDKVERWLPELEREETRASGYTEFQVRKIKVLERMVVTVAQQNECT